MAKTIPTDNIDPEYHRLKRTLKVTIADWERWAAAAELAGVSRNTFITAVCNRAADYFGVKRDAE